MNGIALGSLYGIIGVALVLVYRTSRIINFAAARSARSPPSRAAAHRRRSASATC
jgi:hypothetical protein